MYGQVISMKEIPSGALVSDSSPVEEYLLDRLRQVVVKNLSEQSHLTAVDAAASKRFSDQPLL